MLPRRLLMVFVFALAPSPAQEAPFAGLARTTFADLLKIPLAPPQASVTVHRATDEDGVRIEDVSWDSLDGERVPAFVMRPVNASGRLPAIVCLHGSGGSRESESGAKFGVGEYAAAGQKPHPRFVGWARELARRGYLTIALTQRGLGGRAPRINDQANVMLVQGRTAMGAVLYEIRQSVTYLQSRPDVDPARIGTTGLSFGGITAFYVWILDHRVAAAAPICGGVGSVEAFIRLGSIGYHGSYWWVPGMLARGDQADFAAALAPKPLMVWAPTEDIGMPKEAVDRFVNVVAPAYERAGNRSALEVHQPPGVHEMTMESFEAIERFFDKWLKAR
ncbi:MAG: dienelactone hydrolase family protein [Bryobacteraceae bacterium]|nr:dienelactone hydrolase family protein [Bryobacteraceae bacterium]